jgi:hypothetical protein
MCTALCSLSEQFCAARVCRSVDVLVDKLPALHYVTHISAVIVSSSNIKMELKEGQRQTNSTARYVSSRIKVVQSPS